MGAESARKLRILHTSDLHLGDRPAVPGPMRHSEACLCSLEALELTAERVAADVLIVAGDMFDNARVPDEVLRKAAARLAALPLTVVVLPGNHDHIADNSLYGRAAWREAAGGVRVLSLGSGELVRFPELGLTVWGKAVRDDTPQHRPLTGVPANLNGDWYVLVAHGYYVEPKDLDRGLSRRSSPIVAGDLAALRADYVALGHVDVCRRIRSDGIECWYSGAPLWGGMPATALLVTLDRERGVSVEPVPLVPPTGPCAEPEHGGPFDP